MSKNLFFEIFKIFIWDRYKKRDTDTFLWDSRAADCNMSWNLIWLLLHWHVHHKYQVQIIFCEKEPNVVFRMLVNVFQLNAQYKVTLSSNCYIVILDLGRDEKFYWFINT